MDWTAEKAAQAKKTLDGLYAAVGDVELDMSLAVDPQVLAALQNDLNTSAALTEVLELAKRGDARVLKRTAVLLGLLQMRQSAWLAQNQPSVDLAPYAARVTELRAQAQQSKDFAALDAMKAALTAAGVEVRMSKAGVELLAGAGFDAKKLEGVL
jgi:cysteinyl-tRNA synthetase